MSGALAPAATPKIVVINEVDWSGRPIIGRRDDQLAGLLARPYPDGIGDRVRFDHSRGLWLLWDGTRWAPDLALERFNLLRDRTKDYLIQALAKDEIQALSYLMDVRKQESVFKALSTMAPVQASGAEFDQKPDYLGVRNGTVHLPSQTQSKGNPADLISMSANAAFHPDAQAPQFVEFMNQITGRNAKLVEYLLLIFGASLYGHTQPQQFYVFIGGGNNGKGVLSNVIAHVLGDYAVAPSRMLYMRTRNGEASSAAARPDLMALRNKRFAHMSEPGGGSFNEDLLKEHTGGDPIIGRDLYGKAGDMLTFAPTHTIFFRTNNPPKLEDLGVSMRRRLRAIPFRQDFSDKPDFELETRLKAEADGILRLLVYYAAQYAANPSSINDLPEDVRLTSAEYIEDNDPGSGFLQERCAVGAGQTALVTDLHAAYLDWCREQDDPDLIPMSMKAFSTNLGRRFRKLPARHATFTGLSLKGVPSQDSMDFAE